MTLPNGTSPPALPPQLYLDPIPGIIDFGTVNILAGAPGAGKTTWFAECCARFRDGRSICGHATNKPTGLAYLSTDRGGAATRKLLNQHGLLDGWTTYYNPLDDATFDRKLLRNATQALATLDWCLRQKFAPAIQPGSHLVIDPPAPLFIPGNANDSRSVAALLWELHVIARELSITIFLLCHFAKQHADASQRYLRPQDRISGSGAWSGFSDAQLYMCDPEPPAQPYHLIGWNPRSSAPAEFKFLRQGSLFVPYRTLGDQSDAVKTRIPQSCYDLFILIPDKGCKTDELLAAAMLELGIAQATFYRYLKRLENLGVVQRTHGWVQRSPVEEVQQVPDSESEDKPN